VFDGRSIREKAVEAGDQIELTARSRQLSTIRVGTCAEEGSGVAALKNTFDFTNALLFDLGNGTAIVSAFNGFAISRSGLRS
jgi:hypothetical protein